MLDFSSLVKGLPSPKREGKPKIKKTPKIGVFDLETDPFVFGRIPKVFCAGFYDGKNYYEKWGLC